jgi:hypothetical protein
MDKASETEKKKLKKYYHSWRGFPQLYFIDKNGNLISDLNYPLRINQETHLSVWRDYKNIELNWKRIKKTKRNNDIDLDFLKQYLPYREIKYSSFDLIQISNVLDKYFKRLDSSQYYLEVNWFLFDDYISIVSNPKLFDCVAKNRAAFQKLNGDSIVSNYLSRNYRDYISWRKEEDVDKMAEKYPYNSIQEAKESIEDYKKLKDLKSLFDRGESLKIN